MTVHRQKFLCILLLLCLSLQTSCGKPEVSENTAETAGNHDENNPAQDSSTEDHTLQPPEEDDSAAPSEEAENGIILHSDWLTSAGAVDQTWTKNYDNAEWEDTPCLTFYTHLPAAGNTDLSVFEDELNHRLHIAGYHFHLQFLQCTNDEWFSMTEKEIRALRAAESDTNINLYLTFDYLSDMQNGEVLDLTDYIEAQPTLYAHYSDNVWDQLRDAEGRIYGIPTDPIAAGKLGYAYNPQLASLLSVSMADFTGDPSALESYFPQMLEDEIAPVCLNLYPKDYLMLSLLGLETYGEIFAVRHEQDSFTAFDLFEQECVTDFYKKLGAWMEAGYLYYDELMIDRFDSEETPMDFASYRYSFLQLQSNDKISWFYDVNMADGGGFLETNFFIPDQPAYIYEKINSEILVINAATAHPEECMEFLRLLTLDEEIRLLLYSGIEGYNYTWENDVQVFAADNGAFPMGLGLENDLRFWPVAHFSDLYAEQIEEMNADVRMSASLQHPFDPAGMEESYEACRQLFEDNILIFWGYYGAETEARLEALHEQLIDAGYLELIDAINAGRS
ncbi:MAG: hypothetical protein NC409_13710 [Clostridium sp.]|nr:hypothetical protein [Clostridium sp.]